MENEEKVQIQIHVDGRQKHADESRIRKLKNLPENFDYIYLEPHPRGYSMLAKMYKQETGLKKAYIIDARPSSFLAAQLQVMELTGLLPEYQVWE